MCWQSLRLQLPELLKLSKLQVPHVPAEPTVGLRMMYQAQNVVRGLRKEERMLFQKEQEAPGQHTPAGLIRLAPGSAGVV